MADGDVLKIVSGHQAFGAPTGGGGVTVTDGTVSVNASTVQLPAASVANVQDAGSGTAGLFGNGLQLALDTDVFDDSSAVRVTVDNNETLSLSKEGLLRVSYDGTSGSGGLFVTVADDVSGIRFKVEDDSGASGFYVLANARVQIIPASGATGHMLEIWDAGANNRIFTVDTDGSVHIKTGTTIQADL